MWKCLLYKLWVPSQSVDWPSVRSYRVSMGGCTEPWCRDRGSHTCFSDLESFPYRSNLVFLDRLPGLFGRDRSVSRSSKGLLLFPVSPYSHGPTLSEYPDVAPTVRACLDIHSRCLWSLDSRLYFCPIQGFPPSKLGICGLSAPQVHIQTPGSTRVPFLPWRGQRRQSLLMRFHSTRLRGG